MLPEMMQWIGIKSGTTTVIVMLLFIHPRSDLQHWGYVIMDTCPIASINPAHVSPLWRVLARRWIQWNWTNRPTPALKLLNQPFSGSASQSQQSVIFSHRQLRQLNGAKLEHSCDINLRTAFIAMTTITRRAQPTQEWRNLYILKTNEIVITDRFSGWI